MKRRGQAALEYMTSYGWAFAVLIITLGLLVYFEVLNPDMYMSQGCTFDSSVKCTRYSLHGNGAAPDTLNIELQNRRGKSLNFPAAAAPPDVYIEYQLDDDDWHYCNVPDSVPPDSGMCSPEHTVTNSKFQCSCTMADGTLNAGGKDRVRVKIHYVEGDSYSPDYVGTIYGEIYANVNE